MDRFSGKDMRHLALGKGMSPALPILTLNGIVVIFESTSFLVGKVVSTHGVVRESVHSSTHLSIPYLSVSTCSLYLVEPTNITAALHRLVYEADIGRILPKVFRSFGILLNNIE